MVDKKMPGQRPEVSSPEADGAAAPAGKRVANVKDHIGRQLRALYNEVASQPVPDRFMELLDRLDVKRGDD